MPGPEQAADRSLGLQTGSQVVPESKQPPVSRKAPCPCGSGKKYKKCCGTKSKEMATSTAQTNQATALSHEVTPQTWSVQISQGVAVTVPADINDYTTYVLLEQEDWCDPEIGFVREFIESGMAVLDMDAGYGVYALTMAKEMEGRGRVVVLNANELFDQSVQQNGLQDIGEKGTGRKCLTTHSSPCSLGRILTTATNLGGYNGPDAKVFDSSPADHVSCDQPHRPGRISAWGAGEKPSFGHHQTAIGCLFL